MSENISRVSIEVKVRTLAALDWQLAPVSVIGESEVGTTNKFTLSNYRKHPFYLETLEDLREAHAEAMSKLATTPELKKRANYLTELSFNVLRDVLSGKKYSAKDKLAAARLAISMDPRFLHGDVAQDTPEKVDAIASELLTALERHSKTIQ